MDTFLILERHIINLCALESMSCVGDNIVLTAKSGRGCTIHFMDDFTAGLMFHYIQDNVGKSTYINLLEYGVSGNVHMALTNYLIGKIKAEQDVETERAAILMGEELDKYMSIRGYGFVTNIKWHDDIDHIGG